MTDAATTHDAPLAPGLYLVATPIGNLEDITLRALRVLRSADRIACEDTRQTAKLLNHFGISTPTVSYHLHNETARAEELLDALKAGARIAVVSDAGTPGIADPGAELAAEAIAAGITVYPIPGANAPSPRSSPAASPPSASPSTASFPQSPASAALFWNNCELSSPSLSSPTTLHYPHPLRNPAPHPRSPRRHRLHTSAPRTASSSRANSPSSTKSSSAAPSPKSSQRSNSAP